MSKLVFACATPLFDRLLGTFDSTQVDDKLDSAGLKKSLAREMGHLFSTKSRLTVSEYLAHELTVLDYGLPDFTALSTSSQNDMTLAAEVLTKSLEKYESRLSMVLVTIKPDAAIKTAAHATVMAAVTIGRQALRVDFDVAFTPLGGMQLKPD